MPGSPAEAWDLAGAREAGETEPVERARKLAPRVAALAAEAERARRLPGPLVDALHEARLFRLLLPRSVDGDEVDPVTFVRVIEEVARADASTAWCLCQAGGCALTAAFLAPGAAAEVFGDPRAVLAWGPPAGEVRAVEADGGYRVTGTWSFASGGRHATWLGAQAPVHEPTGTPRRRAGGTLWVRTLLFPAARAAWTDTWDVIGLRATGSDTYTVSDLFVPSALVFTRDDQAERRHPGPLYGFPTGSYFASGFAGVALGLARAMLDAFVELARGKTPRGLGGPLRENPTVQERVARAEATLRAARGFLLGSLDGIWREVVRTGGPSLDQRMLIRLAGTHAIHAAVAVGDAAYHAAGATAIFEGSAFERRFRDLHTVAQQIQGRTAHYETVGRHLLGLTPDATFA